MRALRCLALLAVLTLVTASDAQTTAGQSGGGWQLPADPARWLNAPPLSAESLSGKGVILYFFEEECPRCSRFWPKLQTLSESYANKPVVFIAVNSGTAPGELQRYVRRQKVGWPLIMDYDRSLERSMGVTPITLGRGVASMDNVNHVIAISPQGKATNTTAQQLPAAVEQVLKGAAWRVDPSQVPPPLGDAWRWIEIGAFPNAARDVTKAAESRDEALQAGAETLLQAVNNAVAADQKIVDRAKRKKESWAAYKLLDGMRQRYEGYAAEDAIDDQLKKLAKSKSIKSQVRARQSLEKARRTAMKGTDGAVRRAVGMLNKLIEKDPETEAADTAREFLAKYETQR
ncbi:MAG: TlpA disulfide reductase family protein [Planctomycetota bacterium]